MLSKPLLAIFIASLMLLCFHIICEYTGVHITAKAPRNNDTAAPMFEDIVNFNADLLKKM